MQEGEPTETALADVLTAKEVVIKIDKNKIVNMKNNIYFDFFIILITSRFYLF